MCIDWGRGIWPHSNTWYWSNGASVIDGKLFGFELTWGFGYNPQASATAIFYDGKCHKIDDVYLENDPEKSCDWMKCWNFRSIDKRLSLSLTPVSYNKEGMIFANAIGLVSHQVYGHFNGYVILDDGTRLEVRDLFSFAEKVYNKW